MSPIRSLPSVEIGLNLSTQSVRSDVSYYTLENSHLGQQQVSLQLKANQTIDVSPAGVRYIWLRENMNTMALRVQRARKAEIA
jgi:transposase